MKLDCAISAVAIVFKFIAISKCRVIALLLLAVLIAAAAAFLAWHQPEPIYQGKRLSEWLSGLAAGGYPVGDTERTRAKQLALQLGTNAPDWLVNAGDSIGQIPDQESRALDAVRQIGTKGIPALLGMLQYTHSPLKGMLVRLVSKQSLVRFSIEAAHLPPMRALSGFWALGPAARPAIPELVALLYNRKDDAVANYAGLALAGLGPEALPILTGALTNEDRYVRSGAVSGLCLANPLGPLANESYRVVPALTRSLKDPDAGIRMNAASGLCLIITEPEIVVPALIENLRWDRNWSVRARAAEALGQFRGRAKQAAPALLDALKDSAANVRYFAGEALKRIDPAAAAEAGVK